MSEVYVSFNQIGQQTLTVTHLAPVKLTIPQRLDSQGRPLFANGIKLLEKPRHLLVQVLNAPVRWSAFPWFPPTNTNGILVQPGSYLDWTSPVAEFWGLIENVQFICDSSSPPNTNATLEVVYLT